MTTPARVKEARELSGGEGEAADNVHGSVDPHDDLRVRGDQAGNLGWELSFCFVDERLRGFGKLFWASDRVYPGGDERAREQGTGNSADQHLKGLLKTLVCIEPA
jgi:hypothetical protein